MLNHTLVNPVELATKKPKYPPPKLDSPELLEAELLKKKVKLRLGNLLKGGTVSQVYQAKYETGQPIVVKHTNSLVPFDPTELFIDKEGHNTDTKILKLLSETNLVKVPQIKHHFPDITTTIMEDMTDSGYNLLFSSLIAGNLPFKTATTIATALANLIKVSKKWQPFYTNESAQMSIYERGLELRLAYPNTQEEYLNLEKQFIKPKNSGFVWPDGHPKNMLVNQLGEVVFIDFGRSHWGDQQYMLPNFLAHIVIYALAGYYPLKQAAKYLKTAVVAYQKLETVDEKLFCQYLAMEVLHRANGKWIDGIKTATQKTNLYRFGLEVFDQQIFQIDALRKLIRTFRLN